MEPILNEALETLPEKDRCASLRRFFEKKALKEVGAAMGLNEAAAKKRVSRAVEKLRIIFHKRGVALPSAVLLTALPAHTLQAAPAGLASTLATAAILKGTVLSTSTLTIGKGMIKLMASSKFKTAVAVGVVLLAAGTATLTLNQLKQTKVAAPSLEGSWAGALQADGVTLKLLLKVAKTANGSYAATMDSIDQGVRDVPVTAVSYTNPLVRVELKTLDAEYEARLDRSASAMSGQWRQLGRSYPLLFKRTTLATAVNASQPGASYGRRAGSDLQGYWKGTLTAGDRELRTVVKISEPADGAFIGAMDSIDQGIKDIPITAIRYDNPGVRLELGGIGSFFEGDLNNDATEISGTWEKEGGPALPLVLKRFDPPESEPSRSK